MTEEAPQEKNVMTEILERAGLESINEVPIGGGFSWGKQGVWEAEARVPIGRFGFLGIFAIFQSEVEVRVYAVPKEKPPEGGAPVPHRFTLCKTASTYVWEIIHSKQVFIDEIGMELITLATPGRTEEELLLCKDLLAQALGAFEALDQEGDLCQEIRTLIDDDEDTDEDEATAPNGPTTVLAT